MTSASSSLTLDCAAACTASVRVGDTIALSAVPASRSYFEGWSGACAGSSCAVAVQGDVAVTATFGPTLTVVKSGSGAGVVTSDIGGISCGGICAANLKSGATVTLTALPDASVRFAGWGVPECSGLGACTITMSAVRSVNPSFVRLVTLNVSLDGSGRTGGVTSAPAGIDCRWIPSPVPSVAVILVQGPACTRVYDLGITVSLAASAQTGSRFDMFGRACIGRTCVLLMDADKTVTATFIRRVTITVSITDASGNPTATRGSVASDIAGIRCPTDCSETYDLGTKITLTPQASPGYFFQGWRDALCAGFGTRPCALTLSSDASVIAPFQFLILMPAIPERGAQIAV